MFEGISNLVLPVFSFIFSPLRRAAHYEGVGGRPKYSQSGGLGSVHINYRPSNGIYFIIGSIHLSPITTSLHNMLKRW